MIYSLKNADGSCRFDPMVPGQLRSYHVRAEAGTLQNHDFSSLRVRSVGGCAGREGKLIAGQASPCSIGSHNELGSWRGPQEGPLHSES